MAQPTYTPTHCPQTGRKFTRAERKAANKAKFRATLTSKPAKAGKRKAGKRVERKGQLVVTHLGDALNTRVYTLDAPTPKPKRKPAKASAPVRNAETILQDLIAGRMTLKSLRAEAAAGTLLKPASKRKAKAVKGTTAKVRKATPQERTADKQERAAHGPKGVGPITPTSTPRKADVSTAKQVSAAQGERNRRKHAMKLATKWAYSSTYGGQFLPEQQAELMRLTGLTEVSTYEDVMAASL
jgi:hypothetical protein